MSQMSAERSSTSQLHAPPARRVESSGSWQTAWSPDATTRHSRKLSISEKDELIEAQTESDHLSPASSASPVHREKIDATWDKFAKELQRQDEDCAKVWKEEIDALLVFAGLFSAVLTAFNVDIYKSLKPSSPSTPDVNTQALMQLIALLSNGNVPVMLATSTASSDDPAATYVWINALWFASLVLSLSSASIGIVIRQWLNYFTSPTPTTGKQDVYIHCLRWDKGIIEWRVPELMAILPILLQLALTLFFIGLVLLLWTLNNSVAIVTTVFVSALLAFLVFSTVVPAWSPYCPYKSPQALLVHSTAHWLVHQIDSIWKALAVVTAAAAESSICRDQRWLREILSSVSHFAEDIYRRPGKLYRSWASLEQAVVNPMDGSNPHRDTMSWIEDHVFACGHVLLMDEGMLGEVMPTCLMDFNETFDEPVAIEHALKRLQYVFECEQPLSRSMHTSLATLAANALPSENEKTSATVDEKSIWDIMPYILDGGESAVSMMLQHLAHHSASLGEDGSLFTSEKEKIAARLIDIVIRREDTRQIWTGEVPLQDVDHEYTAYIIRIISERFLEPPSGSTTGHPGCVDSETLHRNVKACGLAAYLARSLPSSYTQEEYSSFPEHVTAMVNHVRDAQEQVHLSADRRLRWHYDVLLLHLSHLLSNFDTKVHPNLAIASVALNAVHSLAAARRDTRRYHSAKRP